MQRSFGTPGSSGMGHHIASNAMVTTPQLAPKVIYDIPVRTVYVIWKSTLFTPSIFVCLHNYWSSYLYKTNFNIKLWYPKLARMEQTRTKYVHPMPRYSNPYFWSFSILKNKRLYKIQFQFNLFAQTPYSIYAPNKRCKEPHCCGRGYYAFLIMYTAAPADSEKSAPKIHLQTSSRSCVVCVRQEWREVIFIPRRCDKREDD